MILDRVIEYLEAIKKEYPSDEVHEACDIAIAAVKRELGNEESSNG